MIQRLISFCKEWTLPVAIAVGTVVYLVFYSVPALDEAGDALLPVVNTVFPLSVFMTLFVTFCKVDYHQLLPHRWHAGILSAQVLLVLLTIAACLYAGSLPLPLPTEQRRLVFEAMLTCIIGPAASASPVVAGKLGGSINTMTTFTLISAIASAVMIPTVFPLLEQTVHVDFLTAFLVILEKVAFVLLLPLVLGWVMQHRLPTVTRRLAAMPNLSFYCWAVSLSITTGVTVRNIVHSDAPPALLVWIAAASFALCFVQFAVGRAIGRWLGEETNAGQALFQKNTALSIWVSYMYLNPVASVGAGCYVLWQNIVNSAEIYFYHKAHPDAP